MPRIARYGIDCRCTGARGKMRTASRCDEIANSRSRMCCLLLAGALCFVKDGIKIVVRWGLIRLSKRLPVRFQPSAHGTLDVPHMLGNDRLNFRAAQ